MRSGPLSDVKQEPGSHEDLEDLYENAPCGYLSLEPNGRVFKANATVATWLRQDKQALIGQHLHALLSTASRIFYETHFAPLLRLQGHFNEVALDFQCKDGARLPVLVNATERRGPEGQHIFTRITIFNATERRRYERELVAARTAAEDAQRQLHALNATIQASLMDERATSALREQFIAVLGHDLRNPLAAIGGGMHLLRKAPLDERSTMIVGLVQGSVQRMAGLIDNVLDFARGRLGSGLALERTRMPLTPVLEQVVAELQTTAGERPIVSHFDIDEPIDCDPGRIGQLASNLVGTALTHGATASPIRVEARTSGGTFELSVANAGEPIPPQVVGTIFEPFVRGSLRPGLQGLGLGLYICSEIARAHGGTLEVASDAAETRFTFRMPLA